MDVADALYAEYGEAAGGGIRAGKQDPVFEGGNAYLKEKFPLLDYIRTARVSECGAVRPNAKTRAIPASSLRPAARTPRRAS